MRPDDKDMARLWDMLDAARAVVEFTQERRFEEFLANRMLRSAVERNLEIIGEAARCVSTETRSRLRLWLPPSLKIRRMNRRRKRYPIPVFFIRSSVFLIGEIGIEICNIG